MHRIDSSGATADHLFTDGDETHGVEATTVDAAFLNAAQEELCAVIEGAGLTLAKGDHTQLAQAIAALIAAKAVTIGEASETVAGIIKLATQAMVDAGTDGKAAVTPATLAARLAALVTAGSIVAVASEVVPTGYLECNGALISRTAYAGLFAAIGTAHGAGDGSTTFALPDLRGRFLRGWDHGAGRDADAASRAAAATGGATGNHAGSIQGDAIREISGAMGRTGGDDLHQTSGAFIQTTTISSCLNAVPTGSINAYVSTFLASRVVPVGADNRPANVSAMYCIKF